MHYEMNPFFCLFFFLYLAINNSIVLECWSTGTPHAGIESGVSPGLWTVVSIHWQVILLATETV